jgi:hypothetical protein
MLTRQVMMANLFVADVYGACHGLGTRTRRILEQAHSCALSRRQILPGQCLHDEGREEASVVWIYAGPIGVEDAHDAHIGANLVLEAKRQRLAVAAVSRGVERDILRQLIE